METLTPTWWSKASWLGKRVPKLRSVGDIIDFVAPRIPLGLGFSDAGIEEYVRWHFDNGFMTVCLDKGELVGVGFCWRIDDPKDIPDWPTSTDGEYIYCPLVIGAKDMLPRMIQAAHATFPGTKYLCYQRQHRGDSRMRIWRLKDESVIDNDTAAA